MLKPWGQRAFDEANLYNPAFGALLLRLCAEEYGKQAGRALPFSLSFLIFPLILHRPIRQCLPKRANAAMLVWLQEHPEVRLEFSERATSFNPITREAIAVAIRSGLLRWGPGGGLAFDDTLVPTVSAMGKLTPEVAECLEKARFLGKWLARAGSEGTIYTHFGVMP